MLDVFFLFLYCFLTFTLAVQASYLLKPEFLLNGS